MNNNKSDGNVSPAKCPMLNQSVSMSPDKKVNDLQEEKNYFELFGGSERMSIFVEDFMEGIMGDSELACYHEKFQDPYEMELLKEKLCQYFKFLLGGSRFYIGKPMPEVHKNLGITPEVFASAA